MSSQTVSFDAEGEFDFEEDYEEFSDEALLLADDIECEKLTAVRHVGELENMFI